MEDKLLNEKFWKEILSGEKIISDREAEDLYSIIEGLRKER